MRLAVLIDDANAFVKQQCIHQTVNGNQLVRSIFKLIILVAKTSEFWVLVKLKSGSAQFFPPLPLFLSPALFCTASFRRPMIDFTVLKVKVEKTLDADAHKLRHYLRCCSR